VQRVALRGVVDDHRAREVAVQPREVLDVYASDDLRAGGGVITKGERAPAKRCWHQRWKDETIHPGWKDSSWFLKAGGGTVVWCRYSLWLTSPEGSMQSTSGAAYSATPAVNTTIS
jgi:hypothetical protein